MTIVIGFDAGNSETTLTWRDSQKTQHITIPSYIGSGSLRQLQNVRAGAGGSKRLGKDELVLDHGGRSTFVGKLALDEARDATAARNDVTRYWSGHTLKLLLATLGAAGLASTDKREAPPVRIMTGLPVSVWTPEARRHVQHSLQGGHVFTLNGRDMAVTVDAVGVMMEGAPALSNYKLEDVPQAVVDIGGRTTDLMWFQGIRPVARLCAGQEGGVEKAMDMVAQTVRDQTGRRLTPLELRSIFRAYATDKAFPNLYHQGKPLDLDGFVDAAVDAVAGDIVSFVARTWGDEGGNVATEARRVVLIGGGAHYFRGRLHGVLPQLEVPNQPELSNAVDYLKVGLAASEAGWSRSRV